MLAMSVCPRCSKTVKESAVTCPYCGITLKAYGHPGIPLYRSDTDRYLCDTCVYHADDTCTFPKRPYAQECTLYQTQADADAAIAPKASLKNIRRPFRWSRQSLIGWLVAIGLLLVSFILAATT